MHRILIIVALIGLLAGCATQGNTESTEPGGSVPAASGADSGSAAGTPSAACAEAFAPIAEMNLSQTSELGDVQDELQATIESCESVADWIAGAQTAVSEEVRPGTADLLLRIRCESPELSGTPICQEL